MEFLRNLFSSSDFMPHGYCYMWRPGLVWLHVVSDVLIALAYFSIPFTLIYFIRKRRDVPFNWIFVSFGMFILACGATHTMEVWTLWHATYWLSGAVKVITALASVPTAILLIHLVPQGLALPSPEALRLEIAERARAQDALDEAKNELELRVRERTAELQNTNEELLAEVSQRKQAQEDLRRSEEALQNLAGRLIAVQEVERKRIARELHDDVCQRLAMISHKIEKAAKYDGYGRGVSVAEQLKQIWQQCSSLAGDVQAISHELHPSILENLGLTTAVKGYCREVSQQNGLVVEVSDSTLSGSLPQDVSLSVFRVVQEALRNAVEVQRSKTH